MTTLVTEVPSLPARDPAGHKGTFGTVLIVAGSAGMLGAAILCARGALRGGAGLVRVALPDDLRAPLTVAVPAAVTVADPPEPAWFERTAAVVVGPGLGARRSLLPDVLARAETAVVIDADGLNALAPLAGPLATHAPAVLTPHPGEAARLLGIRTTEVQQDRERTAVGLARRTGQIAVLKGAATVVTDGDRLFVNDTGNPGLATGGSGDVLAGLIGALIAQGMSPFDAAVLGVHAHGAAGDRVAERLSQTGLIAEDLPLALAEVLRP